MESDSDNEDESKRIENNLISRYISDVSYVLLTIWVRCPIQIIDGSNWFVLGSRYNFLLNFRLFLVVLYFLFTKNI